MQQQYVIKAQRFEIMPYFAFTLNDQFVSHDAPGLALNYYITQVLAVGLNGNWYEGLNADSDFNFQNRRAARIAVPLNDYQLAGDLNFTYVPMYGKFAGLRRLHLPLRRLPRRRRRGDPHRADRGHRPGQPQVQTGTTWSTSTSASALRIFFNRWLAAVLEVRDIIFFDKIENDHGRQRLDDRGPVTPAYGTARSIRQTWYDPNTHFTNDVQLQVGLSLFLPTSFEYRLPK